MEKKIKYTAQPEPVKKHPDNETLWAVGKKYNILQKKSEFLAFIDYLKTSHLNNILEIGTNAGGTTAIFCMLADKVTTIDMSVHPVSRNLENEFSNLNRIISRSDEAELPENEKFDAIFIDGGHELEIVAGDYLKFRSHLRPGGVLAFHDILNDGEFLGEKCYIKRLWALISDGTKNVIEFIDTETPADSGYEPLNNIDDLSKWGVIGCLIN